MNKFNKKVWLSVILYMAGAVGNDAGAQTCLFEINAQINNARRKIEMLRATHGREIEKHMRCNNDYLYICEHGAEIDSLRAINERLIRDAAAIIRKTKPMAICPNSSATFSLNKDIPRVAAMGQYYDFNLRQIQIFEQRRDRFRDIQQRIRNKCDSAMYAEIDRYQILIDSLLNEKIKMIR